MWVRAVHKDPSTKQLVLIVADHAKGDNNSKSLSHRRSENQDRVQFLSDRGCKLHRLCQQWTLKIIHEDVFLESLGIPCMKVQESTNQPCANSIDMELITINSVKTPVSSEGDLSSRTSKKLSRIPSEDVIEVFI